METLAIERTTTTAPPEFTLILGGLLALFALGLLVLGVLRWLRADAVVRARVGKIGTVLPGLVRLSGRVVLVPGEAVVSPLSGATCAWYGYSVTKRVDRPHGEGTRRATVGRGQSEAPFFLEDETGRALVDPRGIEFVSGRSGVTVHGPSVGRQAKATVTEDLVFEGDDVLIVGQIQEGGATDRVAAVLRRWKQDAAEMKARFDTNGDGRIDDAEMAAMRAEATREAQGPAEPRLVGPPLSGPWLLCKLSPDALADTLRTAAWVHFAFAVPLGGLAVWLLRLR